MKHDFSGMNAEQLQARRAELMGEMEQRDAMSVEDLEARKEEIEALDVELEARRSAAAEEQRRAEEMAAKDGEKLDYLEGRNMEKVYTVDSPEYRSGFLKEMLGQELTAEERSATEYVATTGDTTHGAAYVLPREMLNTIWDLIDEQHSILADITMYRTGTILEIAKRTGITQGDADDVNENAANDDEINEFVKVTLSGKDFSKHVDISYAMQKMSVDAFEAFLTNEIADRLGAALANDVIAQINTDYDSTHNAVSTTSANKIAWGDIAGAMATLKNALGGAVVYGSRATIYNFLVGMVDTTGRPLYQPNAQAGAEGTLIGCPVKVEDAVGANAIYVGYPKNVVGNTIQDIMIESDRDIKKHVITHSGYARYDAKLIQPASFAKLSVKQS